MGIHVLPEWGRPIALSSPLTVSLTHFYARAAENLLTTTISKVGKNHDKRGIHRARVMKRSATLARHDTAICWFLAENQAPPSPRELS